MPCREALDGGRHLTTCSIKEGHFMMFNEAKKVYDEDQIEYLCALIDSTIKEIKKPRRIQIIKLLCDKDKPLTFSEIEENTDMSRGSLYNHLEKLYLRGIISKTSDRPVKYFLTEFARELLNLSDTIRK